MFVRQLLLIFTTLNLSSLCLALPQARVKDLTSYTLKNVRFSYQPYDAAASPCNFDFDSETNDYLVTCENHSFQVHFFARPHQQLQQNSLEVLMMGHRIKNKPEQNQYYSLSFWVYTNKLAELQSSSVSMGIDSDTARLNVAFDF